MFFVYAKLDGMYDCSKIIITDEFSDNLGKEWYNLTFKYENFKDLLYACFKRLMNTFDTVEYIECRFEDTFKITKNEIKEMCANKFI